MHSESQINRVPKRVKSEIIDNCINQLIDCLESSELGPTSHCLSRQQYFTYYGIWLIHTVGLIARYLEGQDDTSIVTAYERTAYSRYKLDDETDYKYCIYAARLYGSHESPRALRDRLQEILGISLETSGLEHHINPIRPHRISIQEDLLEYILQNVCLRSAYQNISASQYSKLIRLIDSVLPRSIVKPNIDVAQHGLHKTSRSCRAYMYGESLTENQQACNKLMTIKQHGLQERLIDFHPHLYYVSKSLFRYQPFNQFVVQAEERAYLCWPLAKRIVTNSLISLIPRYPSRTVIVYTSSTVANQNLIGDNQVVSQYWKDISSLARLVAKIYPVVVRPTPRCILQSAAELSKLERIDNVIVDYKRVIKPGLLGTVIVTSFTTYILESALSLQSLYVYLPDYRPNSWLNQTGISFFKKSRLSAVTFRCLKSLASHLKLINKKPFADAHIQIRMKIALLAAVCLGASK